jgi:large subunit ribosomal protein L3
LTSRAKAPINGTLASYGWPVHKEFFMAERMGLLAKKVGMTQTFDSSGGWLAMSVLEVGPCVVLEIKTPKRNGYAAIQLGFGEQKAHRIKRPLTGIFAKAQTTPKRFIREIRLSEDELGQFSVGQTVSVGEVFRPGDILDVSGTSRGKGFQGVMKRYHFGGFRATHGTHEYFRHGGSIGCRLTPGRVVKGRKMPGQMGNKAVTVQGLRIHEVIPEKNLLLVKGAVPGAPESLLVVRHATKRLLPAFELISSEPAPEQAEEAEASQAAE